MKTVQRRSMLVTGLALAAGLGRDAIAQGAPNAPGKAGKPGAPQVADAWAHATVPGQRAGGGFLAIVGGAADDRLLAARAAVAPTVELHSMQMAGDVMQMRQVDAIAVPAGKTVRLEPGGLHVMFIGLAKPLKAGSQFALTLRFEKAGEVTVPMTVRAATAMPGGKP